MKRLAAHAVLLLSLISYQALASDLLLTVFLDDAPLSGAVVMLDERNVGKTNSLGSATATLEEGSHVVTLVAPDATFPVEFSSAAQEDVEIKVSFTSGAGDKPGVSIQKFGVGAEGGAGFITGKVLDSSGTAIAGATVAIPNTSNSAITDEFGVYELNLPRGEYQLVVNAAGFEEASAENVRVMADVGVNATVTLQPEGTAAAGGAGAVAVGAGTAGDVEEVFVMGVFNPKDDAVSIERNAESITSAIDIAQLERFGDSDVGSALNRVSGVAVVDRKYATVRGLDGRYISSTLNGLLMPSTDTQRREVELDLFPTVIVGGIEIQKSYTADQLASTTGGAIMIETKGIPDERILKVSGALGYNPSTTGSDILSYASSNGDWAGYDSGLRDLPGVLGATNGGRSLTVCDPAVDPELCTSPAQAAQLGVQFQDDYRVGDKTALPNAEMSVAYGDRRPLGDNSLGWYLAADLDRATTDRGNAELSNPLGVVGSYERSEETTAVTGYGAVGYEYGDANEVVSKTMYLRSTDDITRVESGIDESEDNKIDTSLLDWVEREFLSQAFTGHNDFEYKDVVHQLDWRGAWSKTETDEPDRRTYTYFNNILSTSAFERRWSNLDETSYDLGADYSVALEWGDGNSTELQAGGMWSDKDRTFEQYRFGIGFTDLGQDIDLNIDQNLETEVLPYENFALEKVVLKANTTDTDSYDSQEKLYAYYLNTVTELGEDWTLVLGARNETFEQGLQYPNAPGADSDLEYDDWYPALNVTWRTTEEIQLRLGLSQTVSYPGIIERSEAQTFDPDTDDPIFGNPDLQVSTIDNYDLRAEYYFSETESVSLALFYKEIEQPVERAIPDASGSAASDATTFVNQESAELTGAEIDAYKEVLSEDDYLVFVGGNLSYIDSEVDFSADSIRLEGASANGRQLQGQSEWLSNLQVGMDHFPTEQKFTLLVNYFDDRIYRVARGNATGPEYEDARIIVDFTYEKVWSDELVIEASVKNVLNTEVEFSQNGNTIESYNVGRFFKAGVTYKF